MDKQEIVINLKSPIETKINSLLGLFESFMTYRQTTGVAFGPAGFESISNIIEYHSVNPGPFRILQTIPERQKITVEQASKIIKQGDGIVRQTK